MSMQRVESDLKPFRKDSDPAKAGLAGIISNSLETWIELYDDFPLLPVTPPASDASSAVEKPTAETSEVLPDLRQRTYELLSKVRKPSDEERKSLTDKGFIFLPIEAKTLIKVVSEHPDHFWSDQLQFIANLSHPDLRTYVPKAMEVAFNPSRLYIPDSFDKAQQAQLEMTENYSQANLEKELPDAKVLMLPATVSAQADIAYFQMTKGQPLFRDRFIRALDKTAGSLIASVGRVRPGVRLAVDGWGAGVGYGNVGVPLAVVFLQK